MNTVLNLSIKKDEMLSKHCRFGVGGPADYFVEASSVKELKEAFIFAKDKNLNHFVYGGGSNIFFDDKGFRGIVIRLQDGGFEIKTNNTVVVSAGYDLPVLVRELAEKGVGGLEFLANIPGSVGGAVVGNAGCYGKSIGEVLQVARVYSVADNKVEIWKPKDFEFAYRHSRIKNENDKIILNITLKTVQRNPKKIMDEIGAELDERLDKHPHNAMCAGSFFKNPNNRPAWKVITDAGMADTRVGDAHLSEKHANFLVNKNKATSQDILELVRLIQKETRDKLGIKLEPEVRYVGENGLEKI